MISIKGFTDFELYNSSGPLDPGAPIALFGPLPVVGAYFELRSPPVFNRATRSVTLRLEWQDLPDGDLSGFIVELSPGEYAPLFSEAIRIDPPAIYGSLRVTLVAPPGGFGHQTYAGRCAEAALHRQPFPPPPYIPMVKRLWLDYETVV